MLDIYSDYLICQTKYATATGLSDMLPGEISHDQVTRFLNGTEMGSKELWQWVKPKVRRCEQPSGGVLILDDTIEEKPYTDENAIVCWHHSHMTGKHVKGINILSCLVRYGDVSFPVGYEIVHKDVCYCDVATKKEHRKASVNKNVHFRNLVTQSVKNGVLFDHVLADNWFAAKENLNCLHYELNKHFIIGIKSNRTVALSQDDKKRKAFLRVDTLDMEDGASKKVWLKDNSFPVMLIKKIFKNEDGTTGVLYLISNDIDRDADALYNIYQKRWRIETYHKSIKQNSSLAKSPTKRVKSQSNHIFASIVAYCKLEMLTITTSANHFALKYKLLVKANIAALKELRILKNQNADA